MKFKSIYVEKFKAHPGHTIDEAVVEVCEFLNNSKQYRVKFEFNGTMIEVHKEHDPETVLRTYWEREL